MSVYKASRGPGGSDETNNFRLSLIHSSYFNSFSLFERVIPLCLSGRVILVDDPIGPLSLSAYLRHPIPSAFNLALSTFTEPA